MARMNMQSLLLAGFFCLGVHGLKNEEPAEVSVVSACVGTDVTFPWGLGSSPEEMSQTDMKWIVEDDKSPTPVATHSAGGVFSTSPAYSQRAELSEDGMGMTLRAVTIQDSANYSLVATPVHQQDETNATVIRQLLLTVDGLESNDGDLHVQMGRRALWDSESNQWMIRLSCGNFSFHGQPPFDVTWPTPTGETLHSSNYSQGQFHLHLFSPVPGGRYTCRVPKERFAKACVPATGGSQGDGKLESSVLVDELLARLLIVEAEQRALAEENRDLKAIQRQLREGAERQVEEMAQEREERGAFREEMRELRQEVTEQREELLNRTEVGQNFSGSLARLEERSSLLSTNIAFMTQLNTEARLKSNARVKLDGVRYNAGNAYQAATGEFTAPLSGTYLFFLKTESDVAKRVSLAMKLEGKRILYLHAYDRQAHQTPAGTVVVHLRRGQRVWVDTVSWSNDNMVRYWTTFGGFLIRPDDTD